MTFKQLTKDEAKEELKILLERYNKYKDNKDFIKNEKQVCQSLIVPFIHKVLGWEIEDPNEFKTEISHSGKRIDYLTLLEGLTQFIIEAKSLDVEIRNNEKFYTQAINYALNKDKSYAILTNFRYFIILRADAKVERIEQTEIRRIDITHESNSDFEFLWCFSKEKWSIEKGKSILLIRTDIKKREKIDIELLDSMIKWRELLLNNLSTNKSKNKFDFNNKEVLAYIEEEVQRFIDRLVFICFCEDKELIEPQLKSLLIEKIERYNDNEEFLLKKIRKIFDEYSDVYNSDLFNERGYCDKFYFDDKTLLKIIQDLRKPKDRLPYDFSSISVEILGKAYESFIGHLLHGKKKFREEKSKRKRKKEGIYYTPDYIVEYIVNKTVREYIKNLSFEEINNVKILDPACGSGSFLIKVFDVLVEESSKRLNKDISYEEKKQLVLNCIYGVDKDERACDIAKLSLSLKLAEKDKRLPILKDNIKNGDSIIDNKEVEPKAFKWGEEFKEITDSGGFDIILGNPPYVDIKQLDPKIVRHFFDKYSTVENRMNLYAVFVEKALNLLKDDGYFGFIIPNSILYNESYQKIRALLLDKVTLRKIVRLPDNVFQNVKVETIILIYQKKKKMTKKPNCEILIYPREAIINVINKENNVQVIDFNQKIWETEHNVINISTNTSLIKLLKKIEEETKPLIDICNFSLGLTPYDKYKGHTKSQIEERVFHSKTKKNATFKPLLSGGNIIRYGIFWDGKEYISYGNWLGAPREQRFFTKPRIIIRQIISGKPPRIYAGYTEEEFYNVQIAFNILVKDESKVSLKYLLSILNSDLMNFYHKEKYLDPSKNLFQKILIVNTKKFPIKIISLEKQQPLIRLVDKMLLLNKELHKEKNNYQRERLDKEIKKTDNEIDELVYKLYGITEEEKEIIEENLK